MTSIQRDNKLHTYTWRDFITGRDNRTGRGMREKKEQERREIVEGIHNKYSNVSGDARSDD